MQLKPSIAAFAKLSVDLFSRHVVCGWVPVRIKLHPVTGVIVQI
jgi:hypothetical protein